MKENFCITCGNNFNDNESIYKAYENHPGDLPKIGQPLCPKCCHINWNPEVYPGYVIKKKLKDMDGPSHIPETGWPEKNAGFP